MLYKAGDLVTVDFPGVTGVKRRPALVLSSDTYHTLRPDIIVGLITSQMTGLGATDYVLQDWAVSGLRIQSAFRSFLITLPTSANVTRIGQLSERDWHSVCACLKVALADLDSP